MKKVKGVKEYGIWNYEKVQDHDMEYPAYQLYDSDGKFIASFAFYKDMVYYIQTGIII